MRPVSSFDEAIKRQEAARREADAEQEQAEAAQRARAARQLPAAEAAAEIVRQSLIDMAHHLTAKGAPTHQHTWKNCSSRFAPKQSSPRGFVLEGKGGGIRTEALQLLTKEGRIWDFVDMRGYSSSSVAKGEFQDITGEALIAGRVRVGGGTVVVNDAGDLELHTLIPFSGDETTITPYFDRLAALTNVVLRQR